MKLKIRRVYGIIMGFAIQIVCLYRWIPMESGEVCFLEAFLKIIRSDNLRNTSADIFNRMVSEPGVASDDLSAIMLFIFLACLSILQIMCLIYIPFSFFGRGLMLCGISGIIFGAAAMFLASEMMYTVDNALELLSVAGILLVMVGATFIGCRLLESYDEEAQRARKLRERDKAFRRDRKRRLRFKGRYSSLFYHIIWENCRGRLGDYITFIVAGSMAVGFVISGIGMWTLLKGQELNSILLDFLVLAMVISVFLLVNILLFYLKNRMKSYGILMNLGMRRMTLRFYMTVELICCIFLSVVCGFILGNGLLFGLKSFLVKRLGEEIITGRMTDKTWLMIFISIGLMFLISLMFTRDNYYGPSVSGSADKAVMAERIGVKHPILNLIAGACFVNFGVKNFADRNMAEGLDSLGVFVIGGYFLFKSLWGIWLRCKRKSRPVSYKGILRDNYKYYRFKTTYRYMFFLTVMHIIISFVYLKDIAASVTAETPEALFPYDYVCIAGADDMESFEDMENSGLVKKAVYPMFRVSTPGHADEMVTDTSQASIGQHIGISETTYRQMCEEAGIKAKDLELAEDGSEVHAVYQQDRAQGAHGLGNFLMEENAFIHIGPPEIVYVDNRSVVVWLNKAKEIYKERKIKSEECTILAGALHQGSQEDIIVFSDAYLESTAAENTAGVENETEMEGEVQDNGARQLVLLNLTSEEARPAVEEVLTAFQEKRAEDESYDVNVRAYYDKSEMARQIPRERAMKTEVNVFIIILFVITGFIMFYMKVMSEMEERRKQHTFLALVGMGPKKRRQMVRAEFCDFLILPLTAATLVTGGFLWLTLNLRLYTMAEKLNYIKTWGMLYAVYAAVQAIGIFALEYYTVRKLDKE